MWKSTAMFAYKGSLKTTLLVLFKGSLKTSKARFAKLKP